MNTVDKFNMAELYKKEAIEKMQNGQSVMAIKLLRECVKLVPMSDDYKTLLAEAYCQVACGLIEDNQNEKDEEKRLSLYDKVISLINEALKYAPENADYKRLLADFYYNKAKLLGNQEEFDEDIKCLEECRKLCPNNGYFSLEYGKTLFRIGEADKAIYYLNQLNRTNMWVKARFHIGKIYASLNNFKLAQAYFTSILFEDKSLLQYSKEPSNLKQRDADLVPAVYLELGKLYTKFGLYKEANDSLEKCRSYEENPQVLRYLIFLKIREKNYDDAYFFLRRLLKQPNVDKKDSNLNNLIFFVHHKMGISNENINADSYFCSQVAHYSEDEALGHLLNHYETDKRKSSFNSDISLDQLYYEVQERISNLYPDDMTSADKYYIHLGRIIGKYNGEITSTICVVTVPNTNDIVTMYPIRNNHSLVNRPINKEQCFTK